MIYFKWKRKREQNILGRLGKWEEILRIAVPVVISKLSFTAMAIVDTAMVGRLGATAQGAVGIATTYMFTLYVFGLGLIGVVNTFVAQNHGAGNNSYCGVILGHGLRLATLLGMLTLSILLLSEPLFVMAGLNEAVSHAGYSYMFYRNMGLMAVFWYWAYNNFLEGIGETKLPMYISIAANVVNVTLDYVLIFGFGPIEAMGVEGAGLATALANIFILICFVVVIHRPGSRFHGFGITRIFETTDWQLIRRVFKVGLPMGGQFFLEVGAFLCFSVMVGWIGDDALAAHQVGLRILSVSFMTAWGVSVAATPLVGRHQGAGRSDLAGDSGMRSIVVVFVFTIVYALVFVAVPEWLTSVFTPYASVAKIATSLVYIAAIQIFDGLSIVSYGALKGAGDTRWPLLAVVITNWVIGVPLVYVLTITAGLGALGTWLGILGILLAHGVVMFLRFWTGKWKKIVIVEGAT